MIDKKQPRGLPQLYDDYIKDREIYGGTLHPYKSQHGGQAIMYSFLQKISPFGGRVNLSGFRLLTIVLSALVFALFIAWVYRNFGLIVGAATFLLILLTPNFHNLAFNFGFGIFILIVTACSSFIFVSRKRITPVLFNKYRAIIITTAISITGPLSWLILFPAHASAHTFLDFIVWYMPYALLGFIVIGINLKVLTEQIRRYSQINKDERLPI